nr:hypothetical protein [Eubacterium sp.]
MNTKIKTIFIVMFTFSFIFMLALEFTLPSERNDEVYFCEYFNDGWQQIHSDGTAEDVDIPANLISDNEDETIIETTLPDNVKDDTYIITRSVRADMVIYIDGEVRASYSTSESRLWGKTNPANFVYASLGPMDSGKVVTIYTSTEDYYAGIFYDIYYANYAGFWAHMANENMPTFIFAFVVFVVAFLSLMVSLAFIIILGKDIKFTWLSMEVLLVSTWMITNSVFRQIIFPNVSIISDVSFFCVLFMVIPITEYMNLLQQNRYRKFYLGVEIYSLIAAIAAIILQLFKIYDFAETFNYYAIAIPVMVTMTFMTIIWDIKTGKIKEYLVIAVIFFCTAVVALIQLGAYVLRNVDFDISINAATMLLLLFAGIMDTIKEVISLQKDKQTAVVASEMKTEFLANMSHEIRTP